MDRITKSSIALLLTITLSCVSCDNSKSKAVTITGAIPGCEGKTLYLENLGLSGVVSQDSVTLDKNGSFRLSGSSNEYPDFFRLRMGTALVPFVADSLEQLTLSLDTSDKNGVHQASEENLNNGFYTITGNGYNDSIKALWMQYRQSMYEISKAKQMYASGRMTDINYDMLKRTKLTPYKEVAMRLIFEDPKSPVAYFALMQQVDGELIFDPWDPKDSKVFATVANVRHSFDSLGIRTKQLYNLALRSIASVRAKRTPMVNLADTTTLIPSGGVTPEVVGFIDIHLPDITGVNRSLSNTAKKGVTLLVFSSMSANGTSEFLEVLQTLYHKYHNSGLQIYQVSLDNDPHVWLNKAKDIPWMCVTDKQGGRSQYIGYYGISSLPTLFLINKSGEIILRVSDLQELTLEIERELEN